MSALPPTPTTDDNPFAPWSEAWDSVLQMQQRWWTEWTESLQLWTSWWLTPAVPLSSAEWAQAAEQGLRSATEVAETLAEQTDAAVQAASPVVMTPPSRGRAQARPH